jgi:pyruvate/2-oxoglutarate dehydrogenase complex dihydrolipoamide dehydrogenase (E3) component
MAADDNHYDIIIIGGGSAGYAAARTALTYTRSVAVVEGGKELGGLCILRGCMPSKTLLYSAELLHMNRHAEAFGLDIPAGKVNLRKLRERKENLIKEFASYRHKQLTDGSFKLFRSKAQFLDHLTIRLDDGTELWADKYVIATGSVINEPSMPGLSTIGALTSDDVLSLKSLPQSMIVLGGGVVACEMAQFLSRMGVKVTMIQRNPLLLRECSPDASRVVQQALGDEGIQIFTGTQVLGMKRSDDQVMIHFRHKGDPHYILADSVLNGLGRIPNTMGLQLELADVQLSATGHIETNAVQQTTNPAIYAAGDCAGPHEVVHVAIQQGENAVHHALGRKNKIVDYDRMLRVVFTDPQIAYVGLSREELFAQEIDFVESSYPFCDHGKSLIMRACYGYVRIFARSEDGVILGAECVGKDASELIQSLSVAVATEQNLDSMLKVHWYHPTLSEIWTYPLESAKEACALRS